MAHIEEGLLKEVFDDCINDDDCCGLCGAHIGKSLSWNRQYLNHESYCVVKKIMEHLKMVHEEILPPPAVVQPAPDKCELPTEMKDGGFTGECAILAAKINKIILYLSQKGM